MNVTSTGAVLPAATSAAELPEGGYEVRIDGFDEGGLARCVYPGGFVKHHQAGTVEELTGKVVAQLRGRYGAGEVAFSKAPKAVKAGERFTVKG